MLQGYCLYHAYKNNNDQKWFWLIIFLPLIGCLIYLYVNFYSKENLENVGEGIKRAVNSNYDTQKIEKDVKVSDTVKNRIRLADAYLVDGRYQDALEMYESCSSGFNENDPVILMKLLKAQYFLENYNEVIRLSEKLKNEKIFQNSEEKTALAVALFRIGNLEEAEIIFKEMDARFSNYNHRIEYAKFLLQTGKNKACKGLLYSLEDEFALMDKGSKKINKEFIQKVKNLSKQIS